MMQSMPFINGDLCVTDFQAWVPAPAHGPGVRPHSAPAGRRHQDWLTTTVSFTQTRLHALLISLP